MSTMKIAAVTAFAAGLLASASAYANGGDAGNWQRTQHQTIGVTIPIFGASSEAQKTVPAKHKKSKTTAAAKSCPKSIVYFVTTGGRGGNMARPYTAANFGPCTQK